MPFTNLPPGTLILVLVACVALYFGAKFLFRKGEAVEDRRRQAIKLAGECKTSGLDFLAPVLEDYAVGDYSALLQRLRSLAEDVRDDAQRRALFDRLFESQLAQRMKDPQSRQQIVGAMSRLESSHAALLEELVRHLDRTRSAEGVTN